MANIQVRIPSGMTTTTVHGLHQWDYGRKLEIISNLLPGTGMVEVHFAHAGRKEAIVHIGTVMDQTLMVAVPDIVLEQPAPVIAWVFVPTEEEGRTILTVTLPLIARARPADAGTEPPKDYAGKYTQLLTAASTLIQHTYTRDELAAVLGSYIDDLDALIGGGA